MSTAGTEGRAKRKAGRHKRKKATKVLARKPAGTFPTDEESIAYRQMNASEERAAVETVRVYGEFYGDYHVASTQWPEPYHVEIRSLSNRTNSCTCPDYQMNRLGTCKHIERVLQFICHRRKRRFAAAAKGGSPLYEVYLDTRAEPMVLRLQEPSAPQSRARSTLAPFFGADKTLLGEPTSGVPAVRRAVAHAPKAAQRRIRVSATITPWIEQVRRARAKASAREAFLQDVRQGKRTLDPVRLPLYPYQQEGMLHLAFGERAMLADEMGLGKTVQAIAACELLHQLRDVQRVLVVSPASLKAEWEEQIRQFTGRSSRIVFGPRATRLRTYRADHLFFLTNYEQVRGDVDDINRHLAPDVVILDEAQRIKNWPTKTAKTIKRLQSPYAFVLTGTPLENRIEEIYSLVEFLNPYLFGSLFRFQREFFQVDGDGNVGHRNLQELHRRVNSVMLRRRKHDVEGELPERTVNTYFVQMEEEQRARYEDYEGRANRLIAQAEKRPLKKEEFEHLQRLLSCMRMVCDTPAILDPECRICPKLKELDAILDDVLADPTAKVIVFSEWVRMLELVKELAVEKGVGFAEHTGKVDQKRRRVEIRRFKDDPDCRLFLSSEAGGTGLNLQVANVVINLDLPWNPARLEQRIARAWRKHQTRSVSVINLVTMSSIEHSMLDKLAFKTLLSEAVLDGKLPDGGLKSTRGRKAFLQQVNTLVGSDMETEATTAKAAKPEVPAPERLKQDLTALFPAQVLGIDASRDVDAYLVVARTGEDAARIRAAASTSVPDAKVEVLDAATFAVLKRLQEQGIIAFTGKTDPVFRSPELGEPVREPKVRRVFRHKARELFETAARKRKMVTLLAGGELYAEALPPLIDVFDTAAAAVDVYYEGEAPALPLSRGDLTRVKKRAGLPFDVLAAAARLKGCDPQAPNVAQVIEETVKAVEAMEQHIR